MAQQTYSTFNEMLLVFYHSVEVIIRKRRLIHVVFFDRFLEIVGWYILGIDQTFAFEKSSSLPKPPDNGMFQTPRQFLNLQIHKSDKFSRRAAKK